MLLLCSALLLLSLAVQVCGPSSPCSTTSRSAQMCPRRPWGPLGGTTARFPSTWRATQNYNSNKIFKDGNTGADRLMAQVRGQGRQYDTGEGPSIYTVLLSGPRQQSTEDRRLQFPEDTNKLHILYFAYGHTQAMLFLLTFADTKKIQRKISQYRYNLSAPFAQLQVVRLC